MVRYIRSIENVQEESAIQIVFRPRGGRGSCFFKSTRNKQAIAPGMVEPWPGYRYRTRIKRFKELNVMVNTHLENPDLNMVQLTSKFYMDNSTLYRESVSITKQTPRKYIKPYQLEWVAVFSFFNHNISRSKANDQVYVAHPLCSTPGALHKNLRIH